MNKYYHEVNFFAFNYWMVLIVISIVLMVLIGRRQYKLVKRGDRYKIKEKFNFELFYKVNLVLTVLFAVLLVLESWRGILQVFDNALGPNDDPIYSVIFAIIAILLATIIFNFSMYEVGRITGLITLEKLQKRRRRLVRRTRKLKQTIDDTSLSRK